MSEEVQALVVDNGKGLAVLLDNSCTPCFALHGPSGASPSLYLMDVECQGLVAYKYIMPDPKAHHRCLLHVLRVHYYMFRPL